jgi:hypothetical protein
MIAARREARHDIAVAVSAAPRTPARTLDDLSDRPAAASPLDPRADAASDHAGRTRARPIAPRTVTVAGAPADSRG